MELHLYARNGEYFYSQFLETIHFNNTFKGYLNHQMIAMKRLQVSGFGYIPDRIRFVPVPIMQMGDCQKSYRFYITERMVCAGYATGGKDACNVSDARGSVDLSPIYTSILAAGDYLNNLSDNHTCYKMKRESFTFSSFDLAKIVELSPSFIIGH